MVGSNSAGDMSAHEGSVRAVSQDARMTVADEHQHMYVQLRPGTQLFRKCVTHLEETLVGHPDVEVTIAGFAHEDHQYRLTLAVDLGPRSQIAKFSREAVAGYNFVQAVYAGMFDFLPLYVTEPDADERARAAQLPALVAAAAVTNEVLTAVL